VRILIYRLGSLGDTVIALPCFRLIRSHWPDAEIVMLTNIPVSGKAAPVQTVLQNTGLVDRFIPYPSGLRDPKKLRALRAQIASEKFDIVFHLAAARGFVSSVRDWLFFRACGIPKIKGVPFRPRDLEPAKVDDRLYENETSRLLRRVGWKQAGVPEDGHDLGLTVEERAEAEQLLTAHRVKPPFIAASIGTKSPLNDWGAENWRALLAQLGRDYGHHALVLLGSADERERSDELARSWPGASANLCGGPSPRLSAAILAEARLFIGHDSGPMHLAAAAGAPVVGVFSARCHPGRWYPSGPRAAILYPLDHFDPARMEDAEHQRRAIGSISVEKVAQAAKSCLSATPHPNLGATT